MLGSVLVELFGRLADVALLEEVSLGVGSEVSKGQFKLSLLSLIPTCR